MANIHVTASTLTSRWAFKEWAAVCEAIRTGQQSLILRKGGIDEDPATLRIDHPAFWLFATKYHQSIDDLTVKGCEALAAAKSWEPPAGLIALPTFVTVERVLRLETIQEALALAGLHIWSDATIRQRFDYKRPGLTAIVVRAYIPASPIMIPDSSHFAGCRSWIDLPTDLSSPGTPVLSDHDHEDRLRHLSHRLPAATL